MNTNLLMSFLIVLGLSGADPALPFPHAGTTGITDLHCPNWAAVKTDTSGRTISTPGTTIQNEEITGQLTINTTGVTLKCVKVNANGALYGVNCFTGTGCPGLVAEDVEVYDCDSSCFNFKGGSGAHAVGRRIHLHDSINDLAKSEGYTEIYDSFFQGIYTPDPEAHNDGFQVAKGTDILLKGNRIEGPNQAQTSAIIVKADQAVINRVRIERNQLSGGSFTLYVREGSSFPMPDNVVIADNIFVPNTAQFGTHSTDTVIGCMEWRRNYICAACGSGMSAPAGVSAEGSCAPPG